MKLILLTTSLPGSEIVFRSELVYRQGRTHVKVDTAVLVCNPSPPRAKMGSRGKIPTASRSVSLVQKPMQRSCLKDRQPRLPSDLHKRSPSLLPTPPPPTLHTTAQTWRFKKKKTPFKQSYSLLNSSKLFQKQFSNFQSQVGVLMEHSCFI